MASGPQQSVAPALPRPAPAIAARAGGAQHAERGLRVPGPDLLHNLLLPGHVGPLRSRVLHGDVHFSLHT